MEHLLPKTTEMNFDSGNLTATWRYWKQIMQLYLNAVMSSWRVTTFNNLTQIGERGREIFNPFTWNEKMKDGGGTKEDDITVKALFLKLEEYCPPKKNLIVKRRKFFTRNQQHETIDAYITKLRNVSSACEFGDAKEGLILYKLVDGIQSYRIRGTLLRKGADWILKRAIDLCRADETTNHEMKIIKLL